MAAAQIIEVRCCADDDWVVREAGGRELRHYPSRQAAEVVARKLARKLRAELLVYANGRLKGPLSTRQGWLRRLFGG